MMWPIVESRKGLCQCQAVYRKEKEQRKEKSTPLGVITGASIPRSSPRLCIFIYDNFLYAGNLIYSGCIYANARKHASVKLVCHSCIYPVSSLCTIWT